MDKPTGIVLCGGGGKGAYQIGVWEAMQKNGMLDEVSAISGTSVGALNAVLMATMDVVSARKIWHNIKPKVLLSPDISPEKCLFSRDGMRDIFKKVPFENLRNSKFKVYITILNKTTERAEYMLINDLPVSLVQDILLASSAMPVAYPAVTINGQEYMDAGINEFYNTPIQPLYNKGVKNMCIISLDQGFAIHSIKNRYKKVDAAAVFPNCQMEVIQPSQHLGELIRGTLNFTPDNIRKLINLGYIDADRTIKGEYIIMKNAYMQINMELKRTIENNFHSGEELMRFVSVSGFPGNHKCLDRKVFWDDVVTLDGFRLQQHKLGKGINHYRILDRNNKCVLFTFSVHDLLDALDIYIRENKR